MPAPLTPAKVYRDIVWTATADDLTTTEALVLLAFADHCRDGGMVVWVSQRRLMQRCKLASKGTPTRVIGDLVGKGWLELLAPAQWRNKRSPTYRLRVPDVPAAKLVLDAAKESQRADVAATIALLSGAIEPDELPRSANQTALMSGASCPDGEGPPSKGGLSRRASSRSAAQRATRASPTVTARVTTSKPKPAPVDDAAKQRNINHAAQEAQRRYGLNVRDALDVAQLLTPSGYVAPEDCTEQEWAEAYSDHLRFKAMEADETT